MGVVVRRAGIKEDNPVLIANVIVLNGQIVVVWRPKLQKDSVLIELPPITEFMNAEKRAAAKTADQ